ncbi:MAG: hypothetical protein BWY56_02048 [Acidobacteria bacterium ADurb.Bin340]|nr:MAG: hypothetical protein BWY56_02048 [Acidobacteria bacterium ADurb.Bin340]
MLPAEDLHRLHHLQRVSDRPAQGLFHARDERLDLHAVGLAHGHHALGQGASILAGLHEGAAAALHIQHQGIAASGELLGHDAGGDEGDALYRRRDIAQRVELAVGRADVAGLGAVGEACLPETLLEGAEIEFHPKAGNGRVLVHGSAGVAQAPPAEHRAGNAAGRHDGTQDQGRLVAHAAGAVLVHLDARDVGQIHPISGIAHSQRQGQGFLGGHAAPADGHEQGRALLVGHRTRGNALHPILDLGFGQGPAQLLGVDQVIHPHGGSLWSGRPQMLASMRSITGSACSL